MKSTGEVMGIARNFPAAYIKDAARRQLRASVLGHGVLSVNDRDKRAMVPIARDIARLGFNIVATREPRAPCAPSASTARRSRRSTRVALDPPIVSPQVRSRS